MNQLKSTAWKFFVISLGLVSGAKAATVGIVDSGTDLRHPDLVNKSWFNPGIDSTSLKIVNDIHGWNFAEENNEVIDYKYLGSFDTDLPKFFEIQLKQMEGTATEDEKNWMKGKQEDEAFSERLGVFANFMHGTHVAAIAARNADDAKIMGAKIIPTETNSVVTKAVREVMSLLPPTAASPAPQATPAPGVIEAQVKPILIKIARGQATEMARIGAYVGNTQMKVANCSFGTGAQQGAGIVVRVFNQLYDRDPTRSELITFTLFLMDQFVSQGEVFARSAPSTLFVMAAGNDAMDNDRFATYPANLRLENSITVAATREQSRLASFSNYGAKTVDVAAPGVGIRSAIPGGGYMAVSGTSQAAPFVANVAGRVMDTAPALKPSDVKRILMETVDVKPFLAGKVLSSGIVNPARALKAAELSKTLVLTEAIAAAKVQVADVPLSPGLGVSALSSGEPQYESSTWDTGFDGTPVPLAPLFR